MLSSTAQLNLSQSTLEEIALNALPLLQALGLEVDEATTSRAGQAPVLLQGVKAGLLFGIDDLEPLIVWK